jgi:hypothetical protein
MLGTANGTGFCFVDRPSMDYDEIACRLGERQRTRTYALDVAFDLDLGPPFAAATARRISPKDDAQDALPFANVHGCTSSEPRRVLAHSHGFIVRARHPGRRLLTPGILPFAASRPASLFALLLQRSGYFFFAVEEKVSRSP